MIRQSIKQAGKISAVLISLTLLSACGTTTSLKKPEFQPTLPVAVERVSKADGSIYSSSTSRFLFEDIKARRLGDLITVILDERTNAAKTATTSTSKDSSLDMPGPSLFGMPITHNGKSLLSASVAAKRKFSGSGDSSQSNSLSGNITVSIADVHANGNMLVRGEKILTLNQGSEVIRISGIVRPVDISPNNTVLSTQIANANITYGGKGNLADSNKAGWLTRVFNSSLWPF
jgi:flagellar L-ring protein precursor FlgH